MVEPVGLGGIQVDEVEEWVKCIREGRFNVTKAEGDWVWQIWIATCKSPPVYIEFNKSSGKISVYKLDNEQITPELSIAMHLAWIKEQTA